MKFRKNIQYELSDYYSINFLVFRKLFILTAAMILILIILLLTNNVPEAQRLPLLLVIAIAVAATGLFTAVWFVVTRLVVKRAYRKRAAMREPREYILDGEGVHISSEVGYINYLWRNVVKAAESEKGFFIYVSKVQVILLPKRLLNAEEQGKVRMIIEKGLAAKEEPGNEEL